jgi:hypothetical protein
MSEDIKTKLEEDRLRLARIARLQIKQKLKHAGLLRTSDEVDDEAVQKNRKGKREKELTTNSGNKKRTKSQAPLTQEFEVHAEP